MLLFFDTETTGLPDLSLPADHAKQARLVELAAMLTEDDGTIRSTYVAIVQPDGWVIPDRMSAIHGITTEIALRCGFPLVHVMSPFISMRKRASVVVGHNVGFDIRMIDVTMGLMDQDVPYPDWPAGTFCTMEETRNICAIPPTEAMVATGRNGFKSPKLAESYEKLFGKPLAGAHNAMTDLRACAAIYFNLKRADYTVAAPIPAKG